MPSARPATDGVPGGTLVAPRPVETAPALPPQLSPELLSGLGGRLDLLVRLGAAHDAGVLSDAEFTREKDRLLAL